MSRPVPPVPTGPPTAPPPDAPVADAPRVAAPVIESTEAPVLLPGAGGLAPLSTAAIAVLTWGFRTGGALLVAGLALAAVRGESLNRATAPFADVFPAVRDGSAAGIVDLAILWLMVTPVATVVVVAGGFVRIGDRRYAVLSFLVLAVLGVSIALALRR